MIKFRFMIIALGASLSFGICQAQNNPEAIKDDFKPAVTNQPGQEFPQVNSQGYARFRIKAPQAIVLG